MKRALPLLLLIVAAGCGSAQEKPTPTLAALLAHRKSVHFVLDGTATVELLPLLSQLRHVPPLQFHATGDASRLGLQARGGVRGAVSHAGTVVVSGDEAYVNANGTWYDLGSARAPANLLRNAHWRVTGNTLRGTLHLSTGQLQRLSGLSLPFGVEGADARVIVRLSRWGQRVTIKRPSGAIPLPHG